MKIGKHPQMMDSPLSFLLFESQEEAQAVKTFLEAALKGQEKLLKAIFGRTEENAEISRDKPIPGGY